ncbi:MAG: hypothetical protein K6G89_08715 [Clostridia bacterium]|nr:hypothetical protein [Clostridia bacterium]
MKIRCWYVSKVNESILSYISDNALEYKILPNRLKCKSSSVIFSSFKDLDEEDDVRVLEVMLLRRESVFDDFEYKNAEWFTFRCINCVLSVDVEANAFDFGNNTMFQTGYCKMTKEEYSTPIVAPKNHGTLMFCSYAFAEYCAQITDNILFEKTLNRSGNNYSKMLQLDYINTIGYEAFVLDSSDCLNRATVVELGGTKKIYVRDPGVYIPTIRREYLEGKEIVATDYIWGAGNGYRMLFCDRNFYLNIIQSIYKRYIAFEPVFVTG